MSDNDNHKDSGQDPSREKRDSDGLGDDPSFSEEFSSKAEDWKEAVLNSKPAKFAKAASWLAGVTPAFKLASWGWQQESKTAKIGATFGAAAALGTYLGAIAYAGSLAHIKWNELSFYIPMPIVENFDLNWPATGKGKWTGGDTSRLSVKGSGLCVSYEAFYKRGENDEDDPFAVRRWQTDIIDALNNPPPHDGAELFYRHNGLGQEKFGELVRNPVTNKLSVEPTSIYGCHQHYDHVAVGVKYFQDGQLALSVGDTSLKREKKSSAALSPN